MIRSTRLRALESGLNDAEADVHKQVVPKKSATFGLPGHRENIVRLNESHRDMCRFDGINQRDKDNLKIVSSNLEDAYDQALKSCESVHYVHLPELKIAAADQDLENRMAALDSPNLL